MGSCQVGDDRGHTRNKAEKWREIDYMCTNREEDVHRELLEFITEAVG